MENELNLEAMYQLAIQENSELRHALRALTVKNAELEQQLEGKDANKKEANKKAN